MKLIKDDSVIITPEIELANLLAEDGKPVITHWYEPSAGFYSPDTLTVRNRAEIDFWEREALVFGSNPVIHDFTTISGAPAVNTSLSVIPVDFDFSEYTAFMICELAADFTSGTTAIIGSKDTSSVVNAPYLLYSSAQQQWRVYGQHTNGDLQIASPMPIADARKAHLYTLSRSPKNGATLSVDGVTVGDNSTSSAKSAITAKSCKLLGFNLDSGAFKGKAGIIILCRRDLSDNRFAMKKIESYLMSKYGIATT